MSIHFSCPNCGQPVQASDWLAGLRTPCPSCSAAVAVPAASTPAEAGGVTASPPPPPEAAEARRAWADDERPLTPAPREPVRVEAATWGVVRQGLTLESIGVTLLICGDACILLVQGLTHLLTDPDAPRQDPGVVPVLLALIALGLVGVALLVMLVGRCMCAFVPAASEAKALVVGSLTCLGLAVPLIGIGVLVALAARGQPGGASAAGTPLALAALALVVMQVLFILFLRRSAAHLADEALAGGFMRFLILSIALPFLVAFALRLWAGTAETPEQGRHAVGTAALVEGVERLILLLWYVSLVARLRTTVRKALRGWREGQA